VDEELDRDNTSIENQKAIISDFVQHRFPDAALTFYEDRDRSGYTFEQREGYQRMRRELMAHRSGILLIKDFSRFSRRNSRGLVELEDLRDAGVRIISIGDGIDFPNDDDWLKIQFQFLINEMPVTDTSKKVRSVITRRQADANWICAAPYGYVISKARQFEPVPAEAETVRRIFSLYLDGWGYKRIANSLTDAGIPTPRMAERERREAAGADCRRAVGRTWSISTVQGILSNDFYIGTLRQGKYTRRKINGAEIRRDESEHLVFENHHQAILPYRTFAAATALREKRSVSRYRGVKLHDNVYSGFLFCGDCGSPMFAMSRSDLRDAYRCGGYHRRGLKACTSHHIRVDRLDEVVKAYIRKVRESADAMLEQLNADLLRERDDLDSIEKTGESLEQVLAGLQEELKTAKRQRIRDLVKKPESAEVLNGTYDSLEDDLLRQIAGVQSQLAMVEDRRSTVIRVNRAARTAEEVFEDILSKPKLERADLDLILDRIDVYEDHINVKLKADVDSIIRCGALPEDTAEPAPDAEDSLQTQLIQTGNRRPDKVFRVNVISEGDPLEIYTSRDGEVIFKKYSLLGGVEEFAAQLCETLSKSTGFICAVSDRDTILAAAGGGRRELLGKQISAGLEQLMENRKIYQWESGAAIPVTDTNDKLMVSVAAPILSEGDLLGLVLMVAQEPALQSGDAEYKLVQVVSGFLGRHMES
jgi:stage V sporulation protein T